MCFGTSELGAGCSKDGLGQVVTATSKICGFFICHPRSAIRIPSSLRALAANLSLFPAELFLLLHLDGEVDFDGDIEWQCGGAEGGARVFAFVAEEFDEEF